MFVKSDPISLKTIVSGEQRVFQVRNLQTELRRVKRIMKGYMISRHELEALSSLPSCSQLLEYEDYFEDDDFFYIISDNVEGATLESLVQRQQLSFAEIWSIFSQILVGIKHLHNNNIIHRDLKLDNIIVTSLDCPVHVKVVLSDVSHVLNGSFFPSDFCGTRAYMPFTNVLKPSIFV
ncbi:hypothetical protein RCL1_009011 [Eukaryota sp. TZLM3-RCL]